MAKHKPSRPVFKGDLTAGSTFFFGRYPQKTDLAEPIEWRVLSAEEGIITAISVYGLDIQPYHVRYEPVSWDTCSLRSWLNSTFLNAAFTSAEQAKILQTTVVNEDNPFTGVKGGNTTKDKVFLLSVREAEKYFPNDEARKCPLTKFALACGAWSPDKDNQPCGRWWLRTPGYNQNRNACVECSGNILTGGNEVDDDTSCCIRPAIRVDAG
jgi:hypothetical protein